LAGIERLFWPAHGCPDETLRLLSLASPDPLVKDAEIAELKKLQSQFDSGQTQLARFGREKVTGAHADHLRDVSDKVLAGEKLDVLTKRDIGEDFLNRRVLLKQSIRERTAQAAAMIPAIAGRFVEFARGHVEELQLRDAAIYKSFGLPFAISPIIATLSAAIARAQRMATGQETAGGSPKQMVWVFGVDL
jgi:hypothetical protein